MASIAAHRRENVPVIEKISITPDIATCRYSTGKRFRFGVDYTFDVDSKS